MLFRSASWFGWRPCYEQSQCRYLRHVLDLQTAFRQQMRCMMQEEIQEEIKIAYSLHLVARRGHTMSPRPDKYSTKVTTNCQAEFFAVPFFSCERLDPIIKGPARLHQVIPKQHQTIRKAYTTLGAGSASIAAQAVPAS